LGGIIGVTGTPGTGKKSVAPILAAKLGLRCVSLNELARSNGLPGKTKEEGAVDTKKLKNKLRGFGGPAVLYGHLLPYALGVGSASNVVILRCEPSVLKKRLASRGYPVRKIFDNVEAELIGLISSDSFDAFGPTKTFEVDTTSSDPGEAAASALEVIEGKREPGPRVDWTSGYDTGAKLRSLLSAEDS
jgi:adenylate kinase